MILEFKFKSNVIWKNTNMLKKKKHGFREKEREKDRNRERERKDRVYVWLCVFYFIH